MTAAGWVWVAVAAILAVLDWTAVAVRSRLLERCAKPAVLLALLAAALTAHPGHAGVRAWLLPALCFGLVGDVALAFARPGHPDLRPAGRSRADAADPVQPDATNLVQPHRPDAGQLAGSPAQAAARRAGGAHRADGTGQSAEPSDLSVLAQLAELAEPAAPVAPARAAVADGQQPPDVLFSVGLASFLLGHLCYCAAMLRYGTDQLSLGFGLVLVLLALLAFGQRVLTGAQAQAGTGLTVAVAAYMSVLGSAVVLGIGTASLWVAYGIVLFAFSDLVLATDRFVRRLGWAPLTVAISYHLAQALLVLGLVR